MQIVVGTTSATIAGSSNRVSLLLKNKTGTGSVFLEISNADENTAAASGTGYSWDTTDSPLSITLPAMSVLNAVSPSGNQTIHMLRDHH